MSTKTTKPPPAILQKSALALERFHSTLTPASVTSVVKNGQGFVVSNKRNHSVKDHDEIGGSLMIPDSSSGGFTRENTVEPLQLLI